MNSTVCGGQKSRYSFVSGLLRCGLCQSSVKVVMSQGKRYIFCSKGCCGLKGCDLEGLEDTVLNTVKEAVKRYMPCENQPDRADEIDFRIKNLVKAIEEGGVSAKYINERINFLENEKNNIVCQAGGKKPVVDFSDIMDNDYKRGIIRAAVEKIVIRENTLEIFYRF